jgi:hypothetical protein
VGYIDFSCFLLELNFILRVEGLREALQPFLHMADKRIEYGEGHTEVVQPSYFHDF